MIWTGRADGSIGIGAGGIARFMLMILKEMGVTPESIFLGKPNQGIFLATIERLQSRFGIRSVDNGRLIMVGDALFSDICGANRLGMTSALVMTGLTTPQMLEEAKGECVPDIVFPRLG
jgi:ribonucleotide monophosphatase NagD (HAD superfamily)